MYKRASRFNKSAPTAAKSPYVIFNPHSTDTAISSLNVCNTSSPWIQIAAIDPGIKNCCIRVERRTFDNDIMKVETLLQIKMDFTVKNTSDTDIGLDTIYYTHTIDLLEKYIQYFITSQYIIIESQLPINYDMVRMSQHIISFLMIYTKDKGLKPLIIEIDPRFKSRIFGAPLKMTKPELKKWAWEYAVKILKDRNDNETANMILSSTKKDDHGDVICYTEAWWIILTNGLFSPPISANKLLKK